MSSQQFDSLPVSAAQIFGSSWEQIAPYYMALENEVLSPESVNQWLADWTRLNDLITEWYSRLNVAITIDTTDPEAEKRYLDFLDQIYSSAQTAEQKLKKKLLTSRLEPPGFENPLRKMRVEADIFREENLPLLSEERKLTTRYNKLIGVQTVVWKGEERTLQQMRAAMHDSLRPVRQRIWALLSGRQLMDRQSINQLWQTLLPLRCRIADNAGLPDYRAYRWAQMARLDYTPQDCQQFQRAIEEAVVPAATRLYERCRQRMGLTSLRPWDLDQDIYPIHQPSLPAYGSSADLVRKAEIVFSSIDPQLATWFRLMLDEGLLHLPNQKGKAPGAYCTAFPVVRRPFIFMNAVGLASDIRTLIHESGHAFHNFERMKLPYAQQRNPGLEFAEVASMALELLAAPYLSNAKDGFFSQADANRFQAQHLEHLLVFWPYMAVVDSFQHWVYSHAELALQTTVCDAKWLELCQRFIPGVDWRDLDAEAMTGWQRKQHIFRHPFYYIEYGLAQLGAVLIWRNALDDQPRSVIHYRQALALGGTATLSELYRTAGAKFTFDVKTLKSAVDLIESELMRLDYLL